MPLYEYAEASKRSGQSDISELLKWTRTEDTVSFGGGLPDPDLFPIEIIQEIQAKVLATKGYHALQYGPTAGEPSALASFAEHMAHLGDLARPEDLCVTTSSQQALDLLALLLVDPGSPVIVEIPSYMGALQVFNRAGADLRGVPLGPRGMDLDRFEDVVLGLEKEGKKPRLVYVIPDFQNPTGVTMDLASRKRLLAFAAKHGLLLVEDSPYRELAFDGAALPSLWSLAGGRGVVLLKTFSKMLFPGFRLGWMAAEPELIQKLVELKQTVDVCTSSFVQFVIAEFLNAGYLESTIQRARSLYRPKRDALVAGLDKVLPPGSYRSVPEGGVFLWATLPEGYDSMKVLRTGLELGVGYVGGRTFHCDGGGLSSMRLNFSFPSIPDIGKGCERLGQALARHRP